MRIAGWILYLFIKRIVIRFYSKLFIIVIRISDQNPTRPDPARPDTLEIATNINHAHKVNGKIIIIILPIQWAWMVAMLHHRGSRETVDDTQMPLRHHWIIFTKHKIINPSVGWSVGWKLCRLDAVEYWVYSSATEIGPNLQVTRTIFVHCSVFAKKLIKMI